MIGSKTLWDSCGNFCKIEMFQIGENVCETYYHDFNSAVPRRYVGPLGHSIDRGDRWIDQKKEAGFDEQLPSFVQPSA